MVGRPNASRNAYVHHRCGNRLYESRCSRSKNRGLIQPHKHGAGLAVYLIHYGNLALALRCISLVDTKGIDPDGSAARAYSSARRTTARQSLAWWPGPCASTGDGLRRCFRHPLPGQLVEYIAHGQAEMSSLTAWHLCSVSQFSIRVLRYVYVRNLRTARPCLELRTSPMRGDISSQDSDRQLCRGHRHMCFRRSKTFRLQKCKSSFEEANNHPASGTTIATLLQNLI